MDLKTNKGENFLRINNSELLSKSRSEFGKWFSGFLGFAFRPPGEAEVSFMKDYMSENNSDSKCE